MPFTDRRDAGRRLARALVPLQGEHPVVVGLPRGGIPVAAEVARALDAPLDVLVVRKLGVPWQPELGFGAIGEGDVTVLNEALRARAGVTDAELDAVAARERRELERRVRRYRGTRAAVPVDGRTVVVIDDGIATGFTARAGIEVLRLRGARHIILAVPVAPRSEVDALRRVADEVVALETPRSFSAIGEFYRDFSQTTDEEVAAALNDAASSLRRPHGAGETTGLEIDLSGVRLTGDLAVPADARGIVIFAHGSGSSRRSPRNRFVAETLNDAGLGTLLFDLLTPQEERDRANVFDIALLAGRLVEVTRWLRGRPGCGTMPIGYFGASTGAAAALWAAADLGDEVAAVVSRGGRPDLALDRLLHVRAPTLLIVGGHDDAVLEMNRKAQTELTCTNALEIVPGATHLFEEPGALERVAHLARDWFTPCFRRAGTDGARS